ncbi:MAG: flagellar basal-body MS-ring/collar protein FliF [Acidimicrobiales bacterium]
MPGFDLAQLRERLAALNETYTRGQKALMVGAVLAVFAGIFMFTRLAGETDYASLYTNLEPADAAAVTERLSTDGVPYRLADAGSTVQVPRSQLYDVRMQLSADGMPGGGAAGWSILDDQGITSSEFSQRVGYQRALEGELARTIRSLDGVESATVHLALPRDTAFALNDRDASASVLIRTRAGASVDGGQVQAIVNLVASSVDRLEPGAVTVADSNGMVLAAPGQRSIDYAGNDMNMRQARAFEDSVAREIQAMLSSVVGPGKAVVTVTADLDFDEQTVTRELYEDPDTGEEGNRITLTESNRTEDYTGPAAAATGILGPEGEAANAQGPGTEYTLDEANVVFGVNRTIEATNRAPGKVSRMSVAVLLDENASTPAMVAQIEQIVAAGADIRPERGDALAVSRLPFDTSVADQMAAELAEADAAAAADAQMELYQTIALVAAILVVLALGYRSIRKAAKRRAESEDKAIRALEQVRMEQLAPTFVAPSDEDALAHADAALDLVELDDLIGGIGTPGSAVEPVPSVALEVAEMIDNQPEEVAQLLRAWLGDRRGAVR